MNERERTPTFDMQAPALDRDHCEVCRHSKPGSSGCWFPLPVILTVETPGRRSKQARRRARIRALRVGHPYRFETCRRFCYYCGRLIKAYDKNPTNGGWGDAATRDHVVPKSKGGISTPSNLVHCCWTCNQRKGSRDHDEFLDALLANDARVELISGATLPPAGIWVEFLIDRLRRSRSEATSSSDSSPKPFAVGDLRSTAESA